MECPRCRGEAPVWSRVCPSCGTLLLPTQGLEPPPDAGAPAPASPGEPPPVPRFVIPPEVREAARKDYRAHLQVGAILALVSTLLVPPVTGLAAVWLGWVAYTRGPAAQRTQGLLVCAAGLVGMAIGLAVALWIERTGFLAPA